jgi:Ca2+-binding RTX toxin-like protein
MGLERLESRALLAVDLIQPVAPYTALEADNSQVGFDFTDTVATSSGVGLDPNAYASSTLGDLVATTPVTVDTNTSSPTMTVGSTTYVGFVAPGTNTAVFVFDSFDLQSTLVATGDKPLAILSLDTITINGLIDLRPQFTGMTTGNDNRFIPGAGGGEGGIGGPGQAALGAPSTGGGEFFFSYGGGGGAFGGNGGYGADGSPFGIPGGTAYGSALSHETVLLGGSGAASGGTTSGGAFAQGGDGGGAIELGAIGDIVITAAGSILANGNNGNVNISNGAGGGGAGGGIFVHGYDVEVDGVLSANGGTGGLSVYSGGGGAGGRILIAEDVAGDTAAPDVSVLPTATGGAFGGSGAGGTAGANGSVVTTETFTAGPTTIPDYDYVINWGGAYGMTTGTVTAGEVSESGGSIEGTILAIQPYNDDGVYSVTVTITSSAGGSDIEVYSITVGNVAPTLAINGASTTNEGATYTLNLSEFDPGDDTVTSWTINWGDSTQVVMGNPASVTHVYADDTGSSSYTITATAMDDDGTFAAGNTVDVTVLNLAPTANAGGPYLTFDDTPITLNGSGTDPAGPANDPLTFTWDLDNDGIFGETGGAAARGNEIGANPVFNPVGLVAGSYAVHVQVSDGDGGVTTATSSVQVLTQGTLLIDGVLYVVGSNTGNDIVLISQCNGTIYVCATFNSSNPATFNAADVTEIQVRTRGGNDVVLTACNVMHEMTIDGGNGNDYLTGGGGVNLVLGGAGNDTLYGANGDDVLLGGAGNDDLLGGNGNDVLVGGAGNDILCGGDGRDVIIGGEDHDDLEGGAGEDILIGGFTIHDGNVASLEAVMNVWGSSASFNARVATLTGSGGLLQAGVAVFDDNDQDEIDGGSGRDLYFADMSKSGDGVKDAVSIQNSLDTLVAVN